MDTVYNWYQIFNTDEFDELAIPSKQYEINMVGIGLKTIFVTKGVNYSITYNDVFLSVNMGEDNPFERGGYAIYIDAENNVWLGITP